MNRQRKIVVTVTYNDLGIIIDTKAEPRKKGEWQETDKYDIWGRQGYKCSVCGVLTSCAGNFCPNCGADMRGEHEQAEV